MYAIEKTGERATTAAIAQKLEVQPASVTEMLKKLAQNGFIVYSPYHGAQLTKKGTRTAKKIMRKHLLLETFLKNILKLNDQDVCAQASALEDSLTDRADQQLCIFLNRPREGPIERARIPHCTKKITCEACLACNETNIRSPF
jgi:DtxR family Mn-dependent transcriptional regulator